MALRRRRKHHAAERPDVILRHRMARIMIRRQRRLWAQYIRVNGVHAQPRSVSDEGFRSQDHENSIDIFSRATLCCLVVLLTGASACQIEIDGASPILYLILQTIDINLFVGE